MGVTYFYDTYFVFLNFPPPNFVERDIIAFVLNIGHGTVDLKSSVTIRRGFKGARMDSGR